MLNRPLLLVVCGIIVLAAAGTYYLLVPSSAEIAFHAPKQCEYDRLQAIAARDGVDDELAAQLQEVTFTLTEGIRGARASGAVARALQDVDCSQVESYEAFKARIARSVQVEADARAAE